MDNFNFNSKFKNPPKARQIKQEDDFGHIEYKWTLCNLSSHKFEKLLTQLNFRLHQGNGEAVYNIGYMDNGEPKGLSYPEILESLNALYLICEKSGATLKSFRAFQGTNGYCANVYITKTPTKSYPIL